ncbi:glycoside hydrolase family 2 protein [Rhodobacteraceae bacterium HSP-20]|uniref:beta-mannosidase n=1 Tax=Paragemmobacter amnigenus TaxID=2852097 RepID=A0ABS6J8K1_9RHOB|nr:glycoside hydrolase family 2 protein [Rhodobacter amnigenus]MBU9698685.1 glycoside hydrolase family 2 protein [Rhodobacter amnigenus]MBV4389912.1 glycoside hydrolase family 2 protein [Rhodobacter amnigenus]
MQDLGGIWSLADVQGEHSVPFAVPGDGISALQAAGVIPDPYHGRNEYGLRWIAGRDWVATRAFDHDGAPCDLVIEGLDTLAEVRLNGVLVLSAANAFRRWRVDAAGLIRRGRNEISVTFRSVVAEGARLQAAQPFFVPWHEGNCPIPNGNMIRKPQCDFGWDWNIALAPFGIWGGIRLERQGARIADVIVTQDHRGGAVEVGVEVRGEAPGQVEVTATLCGVTASAPLRGGVARLVLRVEGAALWWPAGWGAQVLHELTVTLGAARAVRRVGLRDLALVSAPDAAGRSFGFRVNGLDIFARGANWIPADALHGRITQEGVRDLLQSAVDAGMNMIRVWGGGRYEPDWFYDLCDEMGLMVWQDFMFACNLYPSTPDFLAEIDAEVRDVVARLNHHACLALWCGDNELIGALGWFDCSRKDRDRYLVSYDRLNRTVEAALRAVLPGANWWPSSPSPGVMAFGDAWHDDSAGDMHFWSVWHEGRDFDHYRDVRPRFCSEFGFQSYPSLEVIRRFAGPADFNIAAPVMESHQKNAGGNARIAETMFRYFRFPVDFANFVWLSQIQQGLAIRTAVTAWRGLKPHCMGTLYWQLNDTWPVCSWSSLDHGGGWKLLHHMARRFYAPVTVVCLPDAEGFLLAAVNDLREAVELRLEAWAVAMDGSARLLGEAAGPVPVDRAAGMLRVAAGDLGAGEVLSFVWDSAAGAGRDVHAPLPWKSYDLLPAGIEMAVTQEGGQWRIVLTARALAPFVAVEADVAGRFSDNAVTLIPCLPVTITFTPREAGVVPRFTLRDLHSATYGSPEPAGA